MLLKVSASAASTSVSLARRRMQCNRSSSMRAASTFQSGMAATDVPPQRIRQPIDFHRIEGVLFDIDGTLCNSDPLHFKAFQDILVELGYDGGRPIDEEFFKARISGRSNPIIAKDLFPDWTEVEHVKFYTEKEARFRQMADSTLVRLDGLTEFMSWIDQRQLRKAAVTNAPRLNTEMMLAALQLDKYFEAVVLGDECPRPKPFPDPYLRGLELLSLDAKRTIVVEDSPAGTRAAVAAGIQVIGLTTCQSPETLLEAGASIVLSDFSDVMQLIHAAPESSL